MKERHAKEKDQLKKKAAMHKSTLKNTQQKLKELFENAYKPLTKEVEIKDIIIKNQTEKAKTMQR